MIYIYQILLFTKKALKYGHEFQGEFLKFLNNNSIFNFLFKSNFKNC